jgi:hypothetical protein
MPWDRFRVARDCLLGLLLGAVALTLPQGCGPSSQVPDRNSPEHQESMKRSANAYINREAELKKAQKARSR